MPLKRILIIDDARDVGRMYQQALRSAYPHTTITYVPSAEEAMVEVTTFTVDLMVVDIRLPGMSGLDLVRRVRLRQPEIKVIIITGMYLDEDLRRQAREVGASHLLGKPVSVSEFISTVQAVLGEEPAPPPTQPRAVEKARGKTAPLKSKAPEPAPAQAEAAPEPPTPAPPLPTLSEALTYLRSSLGGQAAILLDDTGRVTAQAGDWPSAELAEQIVPDLMAGLSAMQRISRLAGAPLPDAVFSLRGKEFDLVCAPVGRYALLLFLKSGPGALRTALAFEEALLAQKQIARILGEMGLNVSPIPSEQPVLAAAEGPQTAPEPLAEEPAPEPAPEELKALEEILGTPPGPAAGQSVDDFWENAVEGEALPPPNPDVLTYEQARKLGLLPE